MNYSRTCQLSNYVRWLIDRIFFKPPILIAGSSVALQPIETHSTSLERSKPLLLTQSLFKTLAAL